jgi:hypothetical protein
MTFIQRLTNAALNLGFFMLLCCEVGLIGWAALHLLLSLGF